MLDRAGWLVVLASIATAVFAAPDISLWVLCGSLVLIVLSRILEAPFRGLAAGAFAAAVVLCRVSANAGLAFEAMIAILLICAYGGFKSIGKLGPEYRPVAWLIMAGILAAILSRASGSDGSPGPLRQFLMGLGLSPADAETGVIAIRKTVHFTYFGGLGWMAYRGLRERSVAIVIAFWGAMGWTLVNAAFDEIRQRSIPGRTGATTDVLLDLAGAAAFVFLATRRERVKAQASSTASTETTTS